MAECEVDLGIGGRILLVMVAGEAMGTHQGIRWPMEGTFGRIDELNGSSTTPGPGPRGGGGVDDPPHGRPHPWSVRVRGPSSRSTSRITQVGPKAEMAAFGLTYGCTSHSPLTRRTRRTRPSAVGERVVAVVQGVAASAAGGAADGRKEAGRPRQQWPAPDET